jgi:hypothetical protein
MSWSRTGGLIGRTRGLAVRVEVVVSRSRSQLRSCSREHEAGSDEGRGKAYCAMFDLLRALGRDAKIAAGAPRSRWAGPLSVSPVDHDHGRLSGDDHLCFTQFNLGNLVLPYVKSPEFKTSKYPDFCLP